MIFNYKVPVGCFGWLCTVFSELLVFFSLILNDVKLSRTSLYGHATPCTVIRAPLPPTLCCGCCTTVICRAVYNVSMLFNTAPIKCVRMK